MYFRKETFNHILHNTHTFFQLITYHEKSRGTKIIILGFFPLKQCILKIKKEIS